MLARPRDRVEPLAVGRGARVEALVAEGVPLHVRAPELLPVALAEAEDRARVRRDAHAAVGERRARVDPAAGVERPPHPAGVDVDGEEPAVRRPEVGRVPRDRGRRLDLRVRPELPDELPALARERRDRAVLRAHDELVARDRRGRRLRRRADLLPLRPCRSPPRSPTCRRGRCSRRASRRSSSAGTRCTRGARAPRWASPPGRRGRSPAARARGAARRRTSASSAGRRPASGSVVGGAAARAPSSSGVAARRRSRP